MRVRSSSLLASTTSARARLAWILAGALALRLALIVLTRNHLSYDVRVFVSWAHLLMRYGTHHLYAHAVTIDRYPAPVNYPPGYQWILVAVTLVYRALVAAPREDDVLLAILLKLPAVAADLALCALAYWIVRRWYGARAGLWAAALAAFSPATWPISALWGQVDAICATFMVAALASAFSRRYTLAWLALGLAVLIKPLPVVVAPLLLAAQLRDVGFDLRSLAGPAAALAAAYVASLAFAPTTAPLGVARWLLANYVGDQSLSDRTSVNAYNLWTLAGTPVSDTIRAGGISLHAWGWIALGTLVLATLVGYIARGGAWGQRARWEQLTTRAWFVVLAGLFCLLTRMHERYILYALALLPIVWFCGKVERVAAVTWLATFVACVIVVFRFYNRGTVPEFAPLTHGLSLLNVIALAAVVYSFWRSRSPLDIPAAARAHESE